MDAESIARIIDAFVDSLDLEEIGSRKGIRSSRKLAENCRINLEVKWMVGGVEPDFRTISDFRKDNIDSMKKIFHEFNRRIWGGRMRLHLCGQQQVPGMQREGQEFHEE